MPQRMTTRKAIYVEVAVADTAPWDTLIPSAIKPPNWLLGVDSYSSYQRARIEDDPEDAECSAFVCLKRIRHPVGQIELTMHPPT